MTQSIDSKVVSVIYGMKRGWVFTPTHFLDTKERFIYDVFIKSE